MRYEFVSALISPLNSPLNSQYIFSNLFMERCIIWLFVRALISPLNSQYIFSNLFMERCKICYPDNELPYMFLEQCVIAGQRLYWIERKKLQPFDPPWKTKVACSWDPLITTQYELHPAYSFEWKKLQLFGSHWKMKLTLQLKSWNNYPVWIFPASSL